MDPIKCSFCGRSRTEVQKLISGPSVFICNDCVVACNDILREDQQGQGPKYPTPRELIEELDRYVIGQDRAKRVLSVAVYNHYKRLFYKPRPGDVELAKGNIMLIGPTGCGKTLLAQTLAKKLDVPMTIADATSLTEAGYVGEDVENIIKSLYRAADGDVERASRGIAVIDEIDKLSRKAGGPSISRDVSGEGVQQGLLKILEGRKATITPDSGRNRPQQEVVHIDTSNILFICTGAFTGIEEVIRKRIGEQGLGFGAKVSAKIDDTNALRAHLTHEDLIKYGMIPEFVGRIPIIVPCDELNVDALVDVLWKPKNALIKQYQRLLAMDGVRLTVTDGAMRALAQEAARRKSGARGLRSIMEEVMLDVMYEVPSTQGIAECIVDEDTVTERRKPTFIRERIAS